MFSQLIQNDISQTLDNLQSQNINVIQIKRANKIEELINTEKQYIQDLNYINKFVIKSFQYLVNSKQMIKFKLENMFVNFSELSKANQKFLDRFLLIIKQENEKNFSKEELKLYTHYGHQTSKLFEFLMEVDVEEIFHQYKDYIKKYQEAKLEREQFRNDEDYNKIIIEAGTEIYFASHKYYIAELKRNIEKYQNIVQAYQNTDRISENQFCEFQQNYIKLQNLFETQNEYHTKEKLEMKQFDDLENYLKLPKKRLQILESLLEELEKLSKNHPDHQNIKNFHKKFVKMNENIQNEVKIYRLIKEIKEKYFQQTTQEQNFDEQDFVCFIEQAKFKQVKKSEWSDCDVVCLKDCIYIFHEEKEQIKIEYNFTTDIQSHEEKNTCFEILNKKRIFYFQVVNEYFSNSVCEIQRSLDEFKESQLDRLYDLSLVKKEWDQSELQYKVEGTEVYDVATTSNYTVYIIKITYLDLDWKIYKSLENLEEVYEFIHMSDPGNQVSKLQYSSWFKKRNDKHLQQNFTFIEEFLGSIFNWQEFKENFEMRKQILFLLGIPSNFNVLPQIFGYKKDLDSRSQSVIKQSEEQEKLLKLSNRFLNELKKTRIIQETIQKFDQKTYLEEKEIEIQIPYSVYQIYEKNQLIKPTIQSVLDSIGIKIKVNYLTKVIQLCEIIAKRIKLIEFHDFRLVLIDSKFNKRVLENDQIVLQSLPKIFIEQTNLRSFFLDQIKYQLYFQKYIFLNHEVEKILYQSDYCRLIMLNDYFFRELKMNQFTIEQYSLIYALFLLIFKKIDFNKQRTFQINSLDLDKLITQKIRKTQTDQYWQQLTEPQYLILKHKLQKICEKQQYNYTQTEEPIQRQARLVLTKFAFDSKLFGVIYFYVGINQDLGCNQTLLDKINFLPNVYLGISYDRVTLFSPVDKKELVSYQLIQIKTEVTPVYLKLFIEQEEKVSRLQQQQVRTETESSVFSRSFSRTKMNNDIIKPLLQDNKEEEKQQELIEFEQSVKPEQTEVKNLQNNTKDEIKFRTFEGFRIQQLIHENLEHEKI